MHDWTHSYVRVIDRCCLEEQGNNFTRGRIYGYNMLRSTIGIDSVNSCFSMLIDGCVQLCYLANSSNVNRQWNTIHYVTHKGELLLFIDYSVCTGLPCWHLGKFTCWFIDENVLSSRDIVYLNISVRNKALLSRDLSGINHFWIVLSIGLCAM